MDILHFLWIYFILYGYALLSMSIMHYLRIYCLIIVESIPLVRCCVGYQPGRTVESSGAGYVPPSSRHPPPVATPEKEREYAMSRNEKFANCHKKSAKNIIFENM